MPIGTIRYADTDLTEDLSLSYNCKENPISMMPTLDLPACDSSNGAISLALTGGVGELHVSWNSMNPPDTTASIAGLEAGIYEVIVTDSLGCLIDTQIILNDQKSPTILLDSISNISCYGGQDGAGAVTVLLDSGTTSATYLWSNGDTDSLAFGLVKGSYQLVVEDNLGCEAWLEIEIQEPDSIDILLVGSNLKCYGDTDGAVLSYLGGGMPPYSYDWSTGDTVSSLMAVPAGMYSLMVTDGNGCQDTATTEVVQPDSLVLSISGQMSWPCQSAFLTVNYTGGVDPVIFNWTGPDGIVGTSNILFGPLEGGVYLVTAQDANGCTTLDSVLLDDCNTGVEEALSTGINSFIISPNPIRGIFSLTLDLDYPQDVNIEILTLQGQVFQEFEEKQILHFDKELNLSDQAVGIYVLQVTTKYGTTSRKIILR